MAAATARALGKLEVGAALREIAALVELLGGDAYRAKAYAIGARAIEASDEEPATLAREGRLTELPGIGKGIASQIEALLATGTAPVLEKLRAEAPRGAGELARVRGMTLKRMRALQDALGIDSVASLRAACEAGRVREVRGFGERTERALLRAAGDLARPAEPDARDRRVLLVDAVTVADVLAAYVRACPGVARAEIAGSVRRWKESVSRVVVVAATDDADASARAAARCPEAWSRAVRDGVVTLRFAAGLDAEVHLVPPARFATAWVRLTGSRAHVRELEAIARARHVALDAIHARDEGDLYARLGLALVPPELREGAGEIERARRRDAFDDLVALDDVRGMVHCHTTYSDGRDTVLAMAREAERMGMEYLTITDHSPTAHYAGGLDLDRLKKQWDEIDEAQSQVKVRLLRGTESDILADGALDWPDRVLERLDVVIASVHARHKMDEDAMTARIVRAMKHPVFKIWGHALGRLVERRPPIACRVPEILDAVAASRAAVEVNGDPYRLDLPPEWIHEARARGIPFVVSVDAHSTRGMHNLVFGVATARRGGLTRGEVLNTRGAREFARRVRPAA
jgi:DNA polymerase (family 10)